LPAHVSVVSTLTVTLSYNGLLVFYHAIFLVLSIVVLKRNLEGDRENQGRKTGDKEGWSREEAMDKA
jgi:hypothetical protein